MFSFGFHTYYKGSNHCKNKIKHNQCQLVHVRVHVHVPPIPHKHSIKAFIIKYFSKHDLHVTKFQNVLSNYFETFFAKREQVNNV